MSKIEVTGFSRKKYKVIAEMVAAQTLKYMRQSENLEIAIEFVSKKEIRRLNRELRGVDKVTDVLSFPAIDIKAGERIDCRSADVLFLKTNEGFIHFGDMALCLSQCKKQAKQNGVTIESEIKKLVIHSCLHLMGYDHIDDADYEIMNKKEIELDKKISLKEMGYDI